jgi:hypothetical protein
MKRRTVNEHRHRALKILRECLKWKEITKDIQN